MKRFLLLLPILLFLLAACSGQISATPPAPITTPTASARATQAAPESANLPHLEDRPCDLYIPKGEVEGETIQCGYVIVPALRDEPDSQPVKLAYVVLKATGEKPLPDPIIHVSGGPGSASTSRDAVLELARRYAPLRETRDIILYDQRGMGRSTPYFDCYGFLGESADASALDDDEKLITACQEAMDKQGYPPEAFSTRVSAADLMDLMTALDYPEYNLYGISYGTRLLMALMHFFPEEAPVRAVVLDSVDTLPEDMGTELTAAGQLLQQDMFESVFTACAEDDACAAVYPDLRAQFDALSEQLDQTPIQLDEHTTVDGDTLYRYTYPYNSAIQTIPYQPRMIMELSQGVTTTLSMIANGEIPEPNRVVDLPPEPEGTADLVDLFLECDSTAPADEETGEVADPLLGYWDADPETLAAFFSDICPADVADQLTAAINETPGIFNYIIQRFSPDDTVGLNSKINIKLLCTEEYPFRESLDEMKKKMTEAGMPAFYVEETITSLTQRIVGCDAWRDGLTQPTSGEYGAYPTLILAGQFDKITPPAWARTASDQLPNAQLLTILNARHSILGNNGPCPADITRQFLAAPGEAVDASCTEEMKVQFLPPSGDAETAKSSAGTPGAPGPG